MARTVDGKGWSEAELIEELREINEHFARIERSFTVLEPTLPNGFPVMSLRRFVTSNVALAESVLAMPQPPRKLLVRTLNELHDCLNIIPFIVHAAQEDCVLYPGQSPEVAVAPA